MQIRDFENTPENYEALAHIMNTVWGEPLHTVDDLKQWDDERPSRLVHHRYLAEIDDGVVGYGSFEQDERYFHPQRFWIHLDVLPDHRQQGIGTQLYEHMLAQLRSEYNANELHTVTTESRPHSIRFLTKHGFQEDKRDPKSRLDVATFDWMKYQGWDGKLTAEGIEIRVLADLMQEDPNALYNVYELHQLLVNDVPEPAERTYF